MIISSGRNYIFVHIPKTGGTSMSLALEAKAMADDIMLGDTPKAHKRRHRVKGVQSAGRLWKHSTLRDIVGLVPAQQIYDANVFTMVRNPWDRAVSYYHWLRTQTFDHPAVGLAKQLEFSPFLNTPQIAASLQASSYGSYVTTEDGQEHCSLFVRLEHLDEDLRKLETLLGCKLGAFPHDNKSQRGSYQEFYNKADRELISKLSAADILRFNYVF